MVDLSQVTDFLMGATRGVPQATASTHREAQRLEEGLVHCDFGDAGHVFLLTATRVRRRSLPVGAGITLGELDGIRVDLVAVSIANHVTLTLEGRGALADEVASEHAAAHVRRGDESSRDRNVEPPPWPASRLTFVPRVSDDLGTRYEPRAGVAGGEEHPWRFDWLYRPTPPPQARQLIIDVGSHRAELPLPTFEG